MVCMNLKKCSFMVCFFSSMRRKDMRRLMACCLLLGKRGLFGLKGRGATQQLASSMYTSLSMRSRNSLSSMDIPSLSS